MKIVEDISYSIDDIIDALNDELGLSYIKSTDNKGYINLGKGIKLVIVFNEDEMKLDSVRLEFPTSRLDMTDNYTEAELYSSSIETSCQAIDIVKRMTGGLTDENSD